MKALISCDERYPDYSIEKYIDGERVSKYDDLVDIPEELFHKFQVIEMLYDEIQNELHKLSQAKPSDGFL